MAITAVYGGDASSLGSTSPALNQVVNKVATSTSLISNPNPSALGQSVTFTATVSAVVGAMPTGTVTFKQGAVTLGTGTLSGGVAAFSTSTLGHGINSITAVYPASANFTGSTANVSQIVN